MDAIWVFLEKVAQVPTPSFSIFGDLVLAFDILMIVVVVIGTGLLILRGRNG